MNASRGVFDEYAGDYDDHRRNIIPDFDAFYGTVLERIPYSRTTSFELLDLGGGTGIGSKLIRDAYPDVSLTLLDASSEMVDRARDRLSDDVTYRVEDFTQTDFGEKTFDVVVSCLALHYVSDGDKASLCHRIYRTLRNGGSFIFGTLVEAPSSSAQEDYREKWISEARAKGTPQSAIEDARSRQNEHELASPQDYLEWLKDAGFGCVDCWYKNYGLAVFSGDVGEVTSRFN